MGLLTHSHVRSVWSLPTGHRPHVDRPHDWTEQHTDRTRRKDTQKIKILQTHTLHTTPYITEHKHTLTLNVH